MSFSDPDALLQPLGEGDGGGEDLSFSAEFDTIAELRREDDASLPMGEWKEKGKEPKVADWPAAAALCSLLLRERSKDLRLVGWLTEAWAQQRGLAGLAQGLTLMNGLIERGWDTLHPRPEGGDMEQRVGALRWLLGRVAPLARRALAEGGRPVSHGQPLPPPRHADGAAALHALTQLQVTVDARLGAEGPTFVAARDALKAVLADLPAPVEGAAQEGPTAAVASALAGSAAPFGGPPQSRAQALQQLRQVAEFFRRTEPHSPVAYLADKAARWGAMDLETWLRTVVKDGGSLAHLEELLGIEPPKSM